MTHYAWTWFKGSLEDAQEIADEWNEITKSDEFRVANHIDGSYLIEGNVESWVIDGTSIDMEFVLEEL